MTLPPLIPLPAGSSFDGRVLTVAGLDLAANDYELVLADVAGAEITPLVSTVGLGAATGTPGGPVGFADLAGLPSDNGALATVLQQHADAIDAETDNRIAADADIVAATATKLATKQPVITERAQAKYTPDFSTLTNENFGKLISITTNQGQPISKNLPPLTLADGPQIMQVRNQGGAGNGDELTLVSTSSGESFVLYANEIALLVAIKITRGIPFFDTIAGWAIQSSERQHIAGRGLVKAGNVFNVKVAVSDVTTLRFTEAKSYQVISSGTFTVDTTGAEPGVVVFAELGAGASQPALPAQFELISGTYQAGKRLGYAFHVMPSGQIEYVIYVKP